MLVTRDPATALNVPSPSELLAGNRAVGQIALRVVDDGGVSRRARVYESGTLRIRFPNGQAPDTLDAVIINSAGGMAGGDRCSIDLKINAGARLNVTTAAAEKIYRSLQSDTAVEVKIQIAGGGALAWLPQETILFDGSRLRRTIDVAMERGARLVLAEAAVFGRSAMGEKVVSGLLSDRWRIRLDGALAFAEAVRLDGDIAERLAERANGGGCGAAACLLCLPAGEQHVAAVRAIEHRFAGEVGISAWNGLAVARLIAADGATLRHDLTGVLEALDAPLPRLWLN